jgi:hypothetical protein
MQIGLKIESSILLKFCKFNREILQLLIKIKFFMKALVIGATGATGKDLVNQLLQDKDFEEVNVFVRKPLEIENDKLKVHIVILKNLKNGKVK